MKVASLEVWRAEHFAAFSGATIDVRVPVTHDVIEGVLARDLRPRLSVLRRLELTIHPGNRLHLLVASERLRWLPPVTVQLLIARELRPGPSVRLEILPGGLASTLAPIASELSRGRIPGVRMEGRSIDVNLAALIPSPDGQTLATWFERGEVTTEAGVAWLQLRLALPPPPAGPEPRN